MDEKLMLIEDIAKKFKQNGESCLLASILFSLALQFGDTDSRNKVLEDIDHIVNGRKSYGQLEYEMENVSVDYSDLEEWTDQINIRAYVTGIVYQKKQEKLNDYLAGCGYTIEMHRPSLDQLVGTIERYPLIWLSYPGHEFFGIPTPFYTQHVISAVRLEDNELVFFEPYAGEIRRREISLIEKIWAGIGVVKQDTTYLSK